MEIVVVVLLAGAFLWLTRSSAEAATSEGASFGDIFSSAPGPDLFSTATEIATAPDVTTPADAAPSSLGDFFRSVFAGDPGATEVPQGDLSQGAVSSSGGRFSGILAQLPIEEQAIILTTAENHGIDPVLLAALRRAENGGPQSANPNYPASGNPYRGGEFGIQTLYAPTFQAQADSAATTIANTIKRYLLNTGKSATAGGRYTADFILYFSQGGKGYGGYAPTKADPLNAFHYQNLLTAYQGSAVVA